ncbi:RNA polymerase B [Ceratobasidium sp. 392]|nr:RNA polymerase B [Ceratobasidium sp. 392]
MTREIKREEDPLLHDLSDNVGITESLGSLSLKQEPTDAPTKAIKLIPRNVLKPGGCRRGKPKGHFMPGFPYLNNLLLHFIKYFVGSSDGCLGIYCWITPTITQGQLYAVNPFTGALTLLCEDATRSFTLGVNIYEVDIPNQELRIRGHSHPVQLMDFQQARQLVPPRPLAQPPANPNVEFGGYTMDLVSSPPSPAFANPGLEQVARFSTTPNASQTEVEFLQEFLDNMPQPDLLAGIDIQPLAASTSAPPARTMNESDADPATRFATVTSFNNTSFEAMDAGAHPMGVAEPQLTGLPAIMFAGLPSPTFAGISGNEPTQFFCSLSPRQNPPHEISIPAPGYSPAPGISAQTMTQRDVAMEPMDNSSSDNRLAGVPSDSAHIVDNTNLELEGPSTNLFPGSSDPGSPSFEIKHPPALDVSFRQNLAAETTTSIPGSPAYGVPTPMNQSDTVAIGGSTNSLTSEVMRLQPPGDDHDEDTIETYTVRFKKDYDEREIKPTVQCFKCNKELSEHALKRPSSLAPLDLGFSRNGAQRLLMDSKPRMTTRTRRTQNEEEDAAALKLGSEFNNAGCLLISEVKYLLEHREKDSPDTTVYNKTLEYVKTFTKFNTNESSSAVRETLRREPNLTQFETAQIANLCPADVDEARNIIPSLVKIDEDRLQTLLDEVQALRKFQN